MEEILLSIITNFGCKLSCPYCIWRNNNYFSIQDEHIEFWKKKEWLDVFWANITNSVSISGGGDPLHDFQKHLDFWKFINDTNIPINIHTADIQSITSDAEILQSISNLRKIVLHITVIDEFNIYILNNFNRCRLRVSVVIDNKVDVKILKFLENRLRDNIRLSYREIVTNNAAIMPHPNVLDFAKNIEARRELGKFIPQGDYNKYLFPNGLLTNKFLYND